MLGQYQILNILGDIGIKPFTKYSQQPPTGIGFVQKLSYQPIGS